MRLLLLTLITLALTSCITVEMVDRRIDPKVVDHNFAVVSERLKGLELAQTITVKGLNKTRDELGLTKDSQSEESKKK